MALFRWFAKTEADDLLSGLSCTVESLGLVVNHEVSSPDQLYATDLGVCAASLAVGVKVIVTWSDKRCGEILIEAMSSEPLLRHDSRGRSLATQLQLDLPPLAE